jgi:hypothetical protein
MNHQAGRHLNGVAQSRVLRSAGAVAEGNTGFLMKELKQLAGASLAVAVLGLGSFQNALADDTQNRIVPVQTSTIPANGDLNPYGVAFVPAGFPTGGLLSPGDILVSNFNAKSNHQGTGKTIVSVTPDGTQSLFFLGASPPKLGLTTALGVLSSGFVIVGNLPTNKAGAPLQGSLIILDKNATVVNTLTDPTLLDGPWDLAIVDNGTTAQVFVSCVLNGTVTRIDLSISGGVVTVVDMVQVASGYTFALNAAALVVGPTGLAYDASVDLLYVASTADNKIFGVLGAGKATASKGRGTIIYKDNQHLHGPLGLIIAPNGDLISSQGDAINPSPDPAQQSEIVEFTKTGTFVGQFSIDSAAGSAFGIAIQVAGTGAVDLAAVNDATNTLTVFELSQD